MPALVHAQAFLGRAEIQLYGIGLKVEPATQTVPKGYATIVSTFLQGASQPASLPPFAPDAVVRATLRGPSFPQPIELTAAPNSPFNIPVLTVPGTHTVDNIRLVSGGEVLLYGSPESVRIEVIEKLLVTTVTARPLTADEIREKGIVFDRSNFQAYNFTAAFAIDDGSQINIAFPVVLPTIAAVDAPNGTATLASIDAPQLKSLQTLIPDTLQIQARIPNLRVVGFSLQLQQESGQDFFVPAIPGVIVIPGDIGFLNQFFSVLLMVANVAPDGSNLVVSDLSASLVLPPGTDRVVGSGDDPLAMARRADGEYPRIVAVTQPGPDGKLGTGDDVTTLGPGQTGNAEFLVEGRREGTHVVEMELAGTLNGLPIGPVPVRGRAAGAVLVRNPKFTLTFTHPDIVNAGEPYTLDVTVTNTSESPANFVSVNLFEANISGARLDDDPTKTLESIPPGDSATVTYHLTSFRTGTVTAATLDSDDNVAGRFVLESAIGELGIPLSPDSLILPKEAAGLPSDLRDAALGLLGRAWAVATAPPAALPKDLTRFSKQLVIDRAVETAEAGFRITLGESVEQSAGSLLFDFLGSEYPDLARKVPANDATGLLALLQRDVEGFDLLRRKSVRGDAFAAAVAAHLATSIAAGPLAFHQALTSRLTSRPSHLSILVSSTSGLPVDAVLVDADGRETGAVVDGKTQKAIPYSESLRITNGSGQVIAQLLIVAVPQSSDYRVRLARRDDALPGAPYDVSVAYPGANGGLRFASWSGVQAGEIPILSQEQSETPQILFQLPGTANPAGRSATAIPAVDPPPSVLGAFQVANADVAGCMLDERSYPVGRVVAVLFSEEVTPESVQDKLADGITAFEAAGNRVLSVALQPGGRIAFVALREPIGPFVPRTMSVKEVKDRAGHAMADIQTVPIVTTVNSEAGVVFGKVLEADGTVAAGTSIRMFYEFTCGPDLEVVGVAEEIADSNGQYQFDYVLNAPGMTVKLVAIDPDTESIRNLRFRLARSGQRLNVDIVLLGRGAIKGRTLSETGQPLAGTALRITSLTDQTQYAATSDEGGAFAVPGVPVGNVLIEAVNVDRPARLMVSDLIPFPGATVTRDLTLLDVATAESIEVKTALVTGRVTRIDGITPLRDVPVIAYYSTRSQPGVACSPPPGGTKEPSECAIAVVRTDDTGAFRFDAVSIGQLRLYAFDQTELLEGTARLTLVENEERMVSILVGGGFGTVRGVVLDSSRQPVTDAVVGGGYSLVNVNPADGTFVLTDVPVGRRKLVAASESLQATGETTIDLVQEGEVVNATIVMPPVGGVAGVVRNRDGVPQPGIKVYVLQDCYDELGQESICVIGETTSGVDGSYRIGKLGIGRYRLSAFRRDLKDGNVFPIAIRYDRQTLVADITFRGGFGTVKGRVLRAESCPTPPCTDTPLPARVSISGERLVTAGDAIGVKFEWVQNYRVVDDNFTTGEYIFSRDVWTGPFTVRAAGQFSPEPVAAEGVMPGPDQTVTIDLRLQPTSRIVGTVFEPDGFTPVTGRQISLVFKSDAVVVFCSEDSVTGESICKSIPQGIQEAFAATDENGRYSFPLVNAGPFTITATDMTTGRVAQVKGTVRAGDSLEVPLRLLGRADVTVRVFRSDGITPVANANVQIQGLEYPKEQRNGIALNGSIVFGGGDALSEGQFVVTAMDANGFAGRKSGRVIADGTNVTVDVFLFDATGTVNGQVLRADPSGALLPTPNAEVILSNASGPLAYTITDALGQFSVPLIPTGAFSLEAFDPTTAARGRASGIVLGGSEAASVTVRLEALGSIRGTVLQSGTLQPLKGWTVALNQTTPSGRGLPAQYAQTGVDGTFVFPGASVGSFRLQASRRDVVGGASATGQLTRGGQLVDVPIVVSIDRRVVGGVTGIVVSGTGSPTASAQVEICASGESCRTTTAGGDGRFAFVDVPLGRFTVSATAQVTGNPSVGRSGGTLLFEGDSLDVTIPLLALSTIEGTVFETINSTRVPAANATVRLSGQPGSGCPGSCQQSTDANGRFRFVNVPARTFTVSASNLTGQQGSVGDQINPGETRTGLEIVLAPAVAMSGRAILGDGTPAGGVVVDLSVDSGHLFAETTPDGTFTFDAIGAGNYALLLQDPIGGGLARRSGIVNLSGPVALGDITLDDTPPAVVSSEPAHGGQNVSRTAALTVTFTEPLNAGTVNATNVTLVGPGGPVAGLVDTQTNDTVVRFRLLPGVELQDQARYTLRVSGVQDRVGRALPADYIATFTTVDVTPPSIVETTPGQNGTGVSIDTTIRIKYSEPVNTSAFGAPPIALSGPAGTVTGRIDFLFADTVVVFTPNLPLAEDAAYTATILPATDLSGRAQAAATSVAFHTTDRTPPAVVSLVVSGNGTLIENTTGHATAAVSTTDVAVVDFFLNDTFVFADRTTPFSMDFVASAALAAGSGQIKVSAVATDTSGNRGIVPVNAFVTVVPDAAPALTITQPVSTFSPGPGQRVDVTVRATDDVGVTEVAYSARTAVVVDAVTRPIAPAATDSTQTFGFNVPADAVAGSLVTIQASGKDTAGHQVNASLELRVRDTVGPIVEITGTTSGQRVKAGQTVTVVVAASDVSGIASLGFSTGGVVSSSDQRTVSPARSPIATSFQFTVPANATSNDRVTLDAFAVDGAGNRSDAARVILPVADQSAPTVSLRTADASLTITPGGMVQVVVDANDDLAVANVQLVGAGAFAFSETKSLSQPVASASVTFDVNIPSTLSEGDVETFTARATDASGNPSVPVSIQLTARTATTLSMTPSLVLLAGDSGQLTVTLGAPAPASGVRVDLVSSKPGVAAVPPSIVFAAGESTRDLPVGAVAGGSAQIDASVDGVLRGTSIVTVIGGVLRGSVVTADAGGFTPVDGAQVTVFHGGTPITAVSGPDGAFVVQNVLGTGIQGRSFSVGASNGTLLGFVDDQLDVANGSASVTVILLPVGAIKGTVLRPDAVTPVPAGASVSLFEAASPNVAIATTFTDEAGSFQFPLVAPGPYIVEASDGDGNRGRASTQVTATGEEVFAPVVYLGRGTVVVKVLSGVGANVAGASVQLRASSLFGSAPDRNGTTDANGEATFANVFVGSVSASVRDQFTNQAGSVSGQVTADGATTTLTVQLAAYGNLAGTVFRRDTTTPVPGARVTVECGSGCRITTTTDLDGKYRFDFLPLRAFTITVSDPATRGVAVDSGAFTVSGETLTRNLVLLPQGALLVTVVDADGNPVNGASVSASSTNAGLTDALQGTTSTLNGNVGQVLLDRLLAGPFTVTASAAGLGGTASGVLSADEVRAVTVQLEPRASIAGLVYEPDGETPASGSVRVRRQDGALLTLPVSNGAFTAGDLRLGTYSLEAFDSSGRRRAFQDDVPLTANGEVAHVTLTFVGLGTVRGRVIHPTGGDVGHIQVQLRSLNPSFGGYTSVNTDAAGNYEFTGVAVGDVKVSSAKAQELLIGEASGTLAQHNQAITLDILLAANAVSLPTSLNDVQSSSYSIGTDGGLVNGTGQLFAYGGTRLTLTVNGSTAAFAGASFGTREENGREIAVRQDNLLGLNVTRKVFVPSTGYFARYLEVLQNPGSSPLTVDLQLASRLYGRYNQFGFENTFFVSKTSSGDNALSVADPQNPDRWVVMLAGGQDPYYNSYSGTPVSFVFAGPGGSAAPGVLTYASPQTLTYGWNSVTIPPNGTAVLMHFVSEQASYAGAEASASRLVQLPPEALAGLSAEEIASIRNFAAPQDGLSALEPLPSIDGTVVGQVFEGDGVTPIANAQVVFQSQVPVLPRQWFYGTNASGQFSFTGAIGSPVPIAPFTMYAKYSSLSTSTSPSVPNAFAAGQTSTTQNLVFSQSGILKGTVRRQDGTPVAGASISVQYFGSAVTGSDGRYSFGGVPASTWTLQGSINHPQGTGLNLVQQTVTLAAGQVRDDVVLVEPTGAISGIVRDANDVAQPNRPVTLTRSNFYRETRTDSGGRFLFGDAPLGSFTVASNDPVSGFPTTATVSVVQDQTTDVTLNYIGKGSLTVTVTRASGVPAQGISVSISATGLNPQTRTTGADGIAGPFTDLPLGTVLTVTASHPGLSSIVQKSTTVTLSTASGAAALTLPAFGSVTGTVQRPNGTLAGANVDVQLSSADSGPSFFFSAKTNANGGFSFGPIPAGRQFRVRVYHPTTTINFSRPWLEVTPSPVSTDAQVVDVVTHYPAIAKLAVTVQTAPGSPIANARVHTTDALFTSFQDRGVTSAAGVVEVAQVQEGPVRIRVYQPGSSTNVLELATAQIAAVDDGGIVPVVITPKAFTVTVSGLVTEADGLTPLGTYSVELRRAVDGQLLATTCVGAFSGCQKPKGQFEFQALTSTGAGLVLRAYSPIGDGIQFERAIVPASDGVVNVTMTLPYYTAALEGHVYAADGVTPVPGGTLFPVTLGGRSMFGLTVAADGTYRFSPAIYPIEGMRLEYNLGGLPNNGVHSTTTSAITSSGQTIATDIVLPTGTVTKITGTVVAGDGVFPLPGASVDVLMTPACAPSYRCSTSANDQGRFEVLLVAPADGQFTVRAHSPRTSSIVGEQSASGTVQSATVDVGGIVVPISVVKGSVTSGPTLPVSTVSVFATGSDDVTHYADVGYDGQFTFYELPADTYLITAQDYEAETESTLSLTLPSSTSVLTGVHVELQEVGRVHVTIIGLEGERTEATVALSRPESNFERIRDPWDSAGTGEYQFSVPFGTYQVQASLEVCESDCRTLYASGTATVVDATHVANVTLRFDQLATALIVVRDGSDQIVAGEELDVVVQSLVAGTLGGFMFEGQLTTDENGVLTVSGLPEGDYVVYVSRGSFGESAAAVATAVRQTQTPVVLRLDGSTIGMYHASLLLGTTGQRYYSIDEASVRDIFRIENGWAVESNAFWSAATIEINGQAVCCSLAGRFTEWPELSLLPAPASGAPGVIVSRRVRPSSDDGFLRVLDTFKNTTTETKSFTVGVGVRPNYATIADADVEASPTSGAYIARSDEQGRSQSFAVVFSGASAPEPPVLAYSGGAVGFAALASGPDVTAETTITLAPGESKSLLTFIVGRGPGNVADAIAAAQALASLSDPDALTGLTRTDLLTIRNFAVTVPPPAPGTLRVFVRGPHGEAREDASLVLVSPPAPQLREPWSTDQYGSYVFDPVAPGTYLLQGRLEECDPDCRTLFIEQQVAIEEGTTTAIVASFASLGSVRVRVLDENGDPASFDNVEITIEGLAGAGPLGAFRSTVSGDLDQNGRILLSDLPPGRVVIQVRDWSRDMDGSTVTVATKTFPSSVDVQLSYDESRFINASTSIGNTAQYWYFVGDTGAVQAGLVQDNQLISTGAFAYSGELHTTDDPVCCALAGRYASDELVLTPIPLANAPGVTVTRRLFVSTTGGFLRWVDLFTNGSTITQQVPVSIWTQLDVSRLVVADSTPSSSAAGFFAASDAAGQGSSFAIVYSGANPPVVVNRAMSDDQEIFKPGTTLTLAPGESVALMHYVLLRAPSAYADAAAAAEALGTQTEPAALEWLTPADLSSIGNFLTQQP